MSNIERKLIKEIADLQNQLRIVRRQKRLEAQSSGLQKRTIEEYNRRKKLNEQLDPLVEHVDLESLTGSKIYEAVTESELPPQCHINTLRGREITFFTPNKRALWQSFGQEFIEPDLLNFIDTVPANGVFFDVGASTGIFSTYAAVSGIKTFCFEPEITNFNILNMNAYLNSSSTSNNLHYFNIALSNKVSLDKIFIRKFEGASHEKILGANNARDGTSNFDFEFEQNIMTMPLDNFCEITQNYPTDIKIDVDGGELDLVEGMSQILKSEALKRIFLEVSHDQSDSLEALKIIQTAGFEIIERKRVQNYFDEYNYLLVRT